MAFVTLDKKKWCEGIYHKGELVYEEIPENLDSTWRYANYLDNKGVEFANIYAMSNSIGETCPESLKQEWSEISNRLLAYYKSFIKSKISLVDNCFFDLVPKQFLLEFCEIKCKIIDHVIKNNNKPENYKHLAEIDKVLVEISEKTLNVDEKFIINNFYNQRSKALLARIKNKKRIKYSLFGAKTGRLTTSSDSFPILNIDKKFRSVLKPNNHLFVELDYNAAEVRTLLALSDQEQPKMDIHEWNAKRLQMERENAKTEIFAWLYGSKQVDGEKFKNLFRLDQVMSNYYSEGRIKNLYKREIETDDFHCLNYLVQSTTADLVYEQVVKLHKLLKNKKSYISFIVHDSVVIDLHKEDVPLVKDLIKTFSETRLGNFPVNVSAGKDFGKIKKI